MPVLRYKFFTHRYAIYRASNRFNRVFIPPVGLQNAIRRAPPSGRISPRSSAATAPDTKNRPPGYELMHIIFFSLKFFTFFVLGISLILKT